MAPHSSVSASLGIADYPRLKNKKAKKTKTPRFIFYPPSLFLSVFILPVSSFIILVFLSHCDNFLLCWFFFFFCLNIKSMTAVHIAQMTKSELTFFFFFPQVSAPLFCHSIYSIVKLLPLYSHAVFIAMIKKSPPFKWFIKKMLYYK